MGEVLRELKESWLGVVGFGLFVLWLLSFPMEGYLLMELQGGRELHTVFLATHTATLLGIGLGLWRLKEGLFKASAPTTALLTVALALTSGELTTGVMGLIGVTSGLLSAWVAASLSGFKRPIVVAAGGLILANLLLTGVIEAVRALPPVKLPLTVIVGLGLLTALLLPPPRREGDLSEIKRGAPVIFLIYLLLGNSYLFLLKESSPSAFFGLDNLFYAAAVAAATFIALRRSSLLLPVTVIALGISVITLAVRGGLTSLAFIQSSAGLADIFTLSLLFKAGASLRGAGIVLGSMVGGILAGIPIASVANGWSSTAPLLGNFVISVLFAANYLLKEHSPLEEAIKRLGLKRESFSKREWQVLEGIYSGKNIKEIAQEIGISESSVKTYTGRIYKKAGVRGKRELLEKLKG